MRLVVDASVAVKCFVRDRPDEPFMAQAEALIVEIERPRTMLFAPGHWIPEVIAVLTRSEPRVANEAILALTDMRPEIVTTVPVMRRAAALSIALQHHLFDTLYHAVAIETGATLVTADERYFEKAEPLGAITMLGAWTA